MALISQVIYVILIIVGLALMLLAGLAKDRPGYSFGWLGAFCIGLALLVQIFVKT